MTGRLLLRGGLVGLVTALLSFCFLKLAGEPSVDRAIAFENAMDEAKAMPMRLAPAPRASDISMSRRSHGPSYRGGGGRWTLVALVSEDER